MRMDQDQSDAYESVNSYSYEALVSIFFRYGEEKFSKKSLRKLKERALAPIETTTELSELIKSQIPAKFRRTGGHPAKRTSKLRLMMNLVSEGL